jgi:hypothetical protein
LLRRRAERIVAGSTMVGQDAVGIGDFVLLEVIDAHHFMQNLQKRYAAQSHFIIYTSSLFAFSPRAHR